MVEELVKNLNVTSIAYCSWYKTNPDKHLDTFDQSFGHQSWSVEYFVRCSPWCKELMERSIVHPQCQRFQGSCSRSKLNFDKVRLTSGEKFENPFKIWPEKWTVYLSKMKSIQKLRQFSRTTFIVCNSLYSTGWGIDEATLDMYANMQNNNKRSIT